MADIARTARVEVATDGRPRAAEVELAPDGDERYGHLLAYLLRTSQQHLVQMSAMADVKANILITTSAIIMTLAFARFDNAETRASFAVLAAFSLIALILAVLAVLPTAAQPRGAEHFDERANILFFGHFTAMPEDSFVERMQDVIRTDETIVRAQLRDIYQNGAYLQSQKFRYLRYAYLSFLAGLAGAGATQGLVSFVELAG